jgi:hypothetical protein
MAGARSIYSFIATPGSPRAVLEVVKALFAQAKAREDCSIALLVFLAEIGQVAAPLANHHEQTPPGMLIVLVGLEMLSQPVDPLRQQSDLNLGRPSITPVYAVLFDDRVLLTLLQGHNFLPLFVRASPH